MVADEVYTARLLKNIIKKLNARLARKQTERDTEAMLEFFARQSKGKVVKEADEKKEISLAAEYSRKGIVREGSEVDYGVNTSVASSVSSKSDDIPIVDEDIPIVEDSILIIEDDIARVDNSK